MFSIVKRQDLSEVTFLLEVEHPLLARAAAPGQFVIVMAHEQGERIPLTLADFDAQAGTITLVVQAAGKSTREMQARCFAGAHLFAVVGPMGAPSAQHACRTVICVGGGLGVAPVFPHLRAHKARGARVVGVIGFRTSALAFWQDRFAAACDELVLCTDDGSEGRKARVNEPLQELLERHLDIDEVIAIGPPAMMRACAETTRPFGVRTTVSLNPIMVDGTGMCGGCRVKVGGEIRFACVDGPDFDAHLVDFGELMSRLGRFRDQEKLALRRWSESCNLLQGGADR